MKKIWMFLFCLMMLYPVFVKAESATLEQEFYPNVYYVMTSKDGNVLENQEAIFRLNGKIAYCLEPNVVAKAGEYRVTEGLSGSYLSKENRKKVEEFGYYGYEYPNHQTKEYYLAAQELIWEAVSNYEVKWMTNLNNGVEINVEREKEEIKRLIEQGKQIPSFDSVDILLYEGELFRLKDENNILDQFQLDSLDFKIENNYIVGKMEDKDIEIKGTQKSYDNEETLLYRKDTSQKMATLRLSEPPRFQVNIKVDGVSVKVHKTGEVWNGIWNSGEWKNQTGVEFQLYAEENILGHSNQVLYQKGELIEVLTTKNGYVETKRLPNGKYRLVESKEKEGYRKIEPVLFEINSAVENNPIIEIKNEFSTGKLEIYKQDDQNNPLSGVVFGLYSKNGRKLDEQTTDQNGKIVWERLPIGEYQIRELETLNGYVLDSTKENVLVKEHELTILKKINVPLLPNTSRNYFGFRFVIGLFGIFISKHFLC